jgi:phosphatidylserine/phosphatidylglycerophosphate/cardiolipin synthase-like enzyme
MRLKRSKRLWIWSAAAMALAAFCIVVTRQPLQDGLAYSGKVRAEKVQLLIDETWTDQQGRRAVSQEIFNSVFAIIDEAEEYLLLDFFLVNDFLYEPGPGMRPLSREITDCLIAKRRERPDVAIVFITDPLNTLYGSIEPAMFKAMSEAGIEVVWTELDRLRDSNPIYSKPWRLLVRPWGLGPGDALSNPLGEGRVSMRSILKLLNFKANHRKLVVSEKSLLITSGNPHSASSAHWNVGLRIDGAGQNLALEAERAILDLSGAEGPVIQYMADQLEAERGVVPGADSPPWLELLTERKIEDKAVQLLDEAASGSRIDLGMFYFSDRNILRAILGAHHRGCRIRVILDPNKDAFGRIKNGIPNRQTALRLVRAGIPVRWADTSGEQFHVKMLYVENPDNTATVLLGSCNFTRRNLDNFNAECNAAFTAMPDDEVMVRARETFDRWWTNPDGRFYTADYGAYADPSLRRRIRAWFMEVTGLSSF